MFDAILIIIAILLCANVLIGLTYWLNIEVFTPLKEAKLEKRKKATRAKAPAKKPYPSVVQPQQPASDKLPRDPRAEVLLQFAENELRMNLLAQDAFMQMEQASHSQSQPQPEQPNQPIENAWEDELIQG